MSDPAGLTPESVRRVSVRRSGGFAGMTRVRERDITSLPAAVADPIAAMTVRAAADCAAAQAARPAGAAPMPDAFSYSLEVQDAGGQVHRWQVGEGDAPDSLLSLDDLLAG